MKKSKKIIKKKSKKIIKKKGGSNAESQIIIEEKCIEIGNDPRLRKCTSFSNNYVFHSYLLNEQRLAMVWNYNVEAIKNILIDLNNNDIELSEIGKAFFLKNEDKGDKYNKLGVINNYVINEFIKNIYSSSIDNIKYTGNLKDFAFNYNFLIDTDLELCTIDHKKSLEDFKDYSKLKNKSKAKYDLKDYIIKYKFRDILSSDSYEKYIIEYSQLISETITNIFKIFLKKMKFQDDEIIDLNFNYDLFYLTSISDASPKFHRNNFNKNRINIYLETSGYNKVDLQFSNNFNNNTPKPELIKIINTEQNNVVWWNDTKIQHRTPVMAKNENFPRVFIFLDFNFNNKNIENSKYSSNENANEYLQYRVVPKEYIFPDI